MRISPKLVNISRSKLVIFILTLTNKHVSVLFQYFTSNSNDKFQNVDLKPIYYIDERIYILTPTITIDTIY